MEEKWLWSCVKIFVEQEKLWWAFGHFSGSGREGAHFLSLCGLMSYQDQVCSALRRQGSQEPYPDECCQRVVFVKLEVLKRPYQEYQEYAFQFICRLGALVN